MSRRTWPLSTRKISCCRENISRFLLFPRCCHFCIHTPSCLGYILLLGRILYCRPFCLQNATWQKHFLQSKIHFFRRDIQQNSWYFVNFFTHIWNTYICIPRLKICQKFYPIRFLCQKFYTLKMRKSGLILPTKHRKFQYEWLIEMRM